MMLQSLFSWDSSFTADHRNTVNCCIFLCFLFNDILIFNLFGEIQIRCNVFYMCKCFGESWIPERSDLLQSAQICKNKVHANLQVAISTDQDKNIRKSFCQSNEKKNWYTNEPRHDKTCLREFPTRPYTNRPAQPQKLARVLKFRL